MRRDCNHSDELVNIRFQYYGKEAEEIVTTPINWLTSVFNLSDCADYFKHLRLLPISGFSDKLVQPVPNHSCFLLRLIHNY